MTLESALLAGGFLKSRCGEAVELMCPSCGSRLGDGILLESMANSLRCPTCAATINPPHAKCLRCGEGLAAPGSSERDCRSASAYRRGEAQPAFAPPEPLWVLQGASASDATVLTESTGGTELPIGHRAGDREAGGGVRNASWCGVTVASVSARCSARPWSQSSIEKRGAPRTACAAAWTVEALPLSCIIYSPPADTTVPAVACSAESTGATATVASTEMTATLAARSWIICQTGKARGWR